MKPLVSIIMGSTSDLPVMEDAAKFFDEIGIPFEMNALSAHRTPEQVEEFAKKAESRGIRVIIAAAGMAADMWVEQLAELQIAYPTFTSILGLAARRIVRQLGVQPLAHEWQALSELPGAEWEVRS